MDLSIKMKSEANEKLTNSVSNYMNKKDRIIGSFAYINQNYTKTNVLQIIFAKWIEIYQKKKQGIKLIEKSITKILLKKVLLKIKDDAKNENDVYNIIKICNFVWRKIKLNWLTQYFTKWRSNLYSISKIFSNDNVIK